MYIIPSVTISFTVINGFKCARTKVINFFKNCNFIGFLSVGLPTIISVALKRYVYHDSYSKDDRYIKALICCSDEHYAQLFSN